MYSYSAGLLWRGHPLFWPDSPINNNDGINCLFEMKASEETHLWFLPVIFPFNLAYLEGRVSSLKAGKSAILKADMLHKDKYVETRCISSTHVCVH